MLKVQISCNEEDLLPPPRFPEPVEATRGSVSRWYIISLSVSSKASSKVRCAPVVKFASGLSISGAPAGTKEAIVWLTEGYLGIISRQFAPFGIPVGASFVSDPLIFTGIFSS